MQFRKSNLSPLMKKPPGWIMFLIFVLGAPLAFSGCGPKKSSPKEVAIQHYMDITRKALPPVADPIQAADFARVNKDTFWDLILLTRKPGGGTEVNIILNQGKEGLTFIKEVKPLPAAGSGVRFLAAGDFNGNRADDLLLVGEEDGKPFARVLFNNKKGYYYKKEKYFFPPLPSGIDRVDILDLDQDRDPDLFFTGSRVLDSDGLPHKYPARLLINNGQGVFEDLTSLLLPPMPQGISEATFADYDGDGTRDVFLGYEKGQNRLLLNNGLGEFSDRTRNRVPRILDETLFVDWADFDQDEDNDLLVMNQVLDKKSRARAGEVHYFLENNGKGQFTKRSHAILPNYPASKVYLLDANGNNLADGIILSPKRTLFIRGRGEWNFANESNRRLPNTRPFVEMTFIDLDGDGLLEVFGITSAGRKAQLWWDRLE